MKPFIEVLSQKDPISAYGFRALRHALWDSRAEPPFLSSDEAWVFLREWAGKHAITGLVWETVRKARQEGVLSRGSFLPWCAAVSGIETLASRWNALLDDLLGRFTREGIPVLLLKGQGAARFYPNPQHRLSGDIDLYVGEDNRIRSEALMASVAEPLYNSGGEKHTEFCCKGLVIELHYVLARFCNPFFQHRLKLLIDSYFPTRLEKVQLQGLSLSVYVFPPELEAFYQLVHIYHHLQDGGVGLRSLCDWALLLRHSSRDMDRDLFARYLHTFHFEHVYGAIACIAVCCLGLPKNILPLPWQDSDEREAACLVKIILKGGNFGRYRKKSSRFFSLLPFIRPIDHFIAFCMRSVLLMSLCPGEALWAPFSKLYFYLRKHLGALR